MQSIGTRIRQRREQLKLSQEELAQKLGYRSRSTINKIENGTNDVAQSKIEQFAKALSCTPAYLMGWDADQKNAPVDLDIANDLANMRQKLELGEGLMFDGEPMTPEAIESILSAMQVGMELARRKNSTKGLNP